MFAGTWIYIRIHRVASREIFLLYTLVELCVEKIKCVSISVLKYYKYNMQFSSFSILHLHSREVSVLINYTKVFFCMYICHFSIKLNKSNNFRAVQLIWKCRIVARRKDNTKIICNMKLMKRLNWRCVWNEYINWHEKCNVTNYKMKMRKCFTEMLPN